MIKRNIIIGKVGGTAGKNSVNYKISIPAEMIKALGVTLEDRSVVMYSEKGRIWIEKDKETMK